MKHLVDTDMLGGNTNQPTNSPRKAHQPIHLRGYPIFLPNILVVYFQEQIGFVLKMIIFSYMA